jgi:hypothetical protein
VRVVIGPSCVPVPVPLHIGLVGGFVTGARHTGRLELEALAMIGAQEGKVVCVQCRRVLFGRASVVLL